jgi:hypothetical protein
MTLRPTEYLTTLQGDARGAEIAMDPGELGTSRQTRHSFSRSLIRHAASGNWRVSKRVWDLDPEGVGHAIYHVDMNGPVVELVVFSHVIAGDMRNDRVIAQDWDVTATLVEGTVSNEDLAFLFRHVTKQEDGRADHLSLIWGRANRSQRFFNYVVDCLASGSQPQSDSVSDAAYILRSTAFYGNGKWGLRDFDGIGADHPLGVPYRAQMLAAWLLREFSADLAEHCARSNWTPTPGWHLASCLSLTCSPRRGGPIRINGREYVLCWNGQGHISPKRRPSRVTLTLLGLSLPRC